MSEIDRTSTDADHADDDRIHLVVIFGGESAEHDVSCTTAAHVLAAADPAKYRITPVGISTDGTWAIAEAAAAALAAGPDSLPGRLDPSGTQVSPTALLSAAVRESATTVVMPLLHGPLGEDGTVQGLLELANMPYVGAGVLASAVAMDKAMAKQVLAAAGIPQARYRAFAEHEMTPGLPAELVDDLGLPAFVKPPNMGSSVGVSKPPTRVGVVVSAWSDDFTARITPRRPSPLTTVYRPSAVTESSTNEPGRATAHTF